MWNLVEDHVKRCNVNLMLCFKLLDTLTYSYSMGMVHVLRVVAITTTHVLQVCSITSCPDFLQVGVMGSSSSYDLFI